MEQVIQTLSDKLKFFFSESNLQAFQKDIQPHLEELRRWHFSFFNPVFDLLLLLTLLLLSRIWGIKKAFSYCLIVSSILYLTSRLDIYLKIPIEESGLTYSDIVRGIMFFIILIVTLYYSFIKDA